MGFVRRASVVAGAVRTSQGRHPLLRRLTVIPKMLRDAFTGRWPQAPFARIIGGVLGIVYVISPIDLMPEFLLGPFGVADDIALAALAVAALLSSAEDYLDAQAAEAAPGAGDVIPGVVISDG